MKLNLNKKLFENTLIFNNDILKLDLYWRN